MNKRVLVTDSSYKHTLGASRALGLAGYDVQVIGPKYGQAGFSKWVEKRHVQRGHNPGEYSSQIAEIANSENIDFLLPVGAASVFEVSQNRNFLSNNISFAIAPTASIELALNKANLLNFADQIGVSVPRTWRFNNYENLVSALENIPLPFIIKSALEQHKFGPVYIYSERDIQKLITSEVLLPELTYGELVVQSLVRGTGEGFFALYQEGICKRVMMHQRLREMPATGGSSWAAQSIFKKDLFESGTALLDSLEWHGPAMVEFKRVESDGSLSLMELNPKLWGSLDLAIASGVDFPTDTVRIAAGEELAPNFEYNTNVKYVWPLENFSLYRRDSELKSKDFQSNILKSDPLPSVVYVAVNVASPVVRWLSKTNFAKVVRWSKKYNQHQFISRLTGELFGIPTRSYCQINDFLWVGAKPNLLGRLLLRLRNRHIISLLYMSKATHKVQATWKTVIPIEEYVDIPVAKLNEAVETINLIKDKGGKVFIHCREGIGRAPTVAIAYLISQNIGLEDAIHLVNKGRDIASVNKLQLDSLKSFIFFRSQELQGQ